MYWEKHEREIFYAVKTRCIACYNNNSQKRFLICFKENIITLFSLTDFQDFPGPAIFFQT